LPLRSGAIGTWRDCITCAPNSCRRKAATPMRPRRAYGRRSKLRARKGQEAGSCAPPSA
jgi:hypothetical protein